MKTLKTLLLSAAATLAGCHHAYIGCDITKPVLGGHEVADQKPAIVADKDPVGAPPPEAPLELAVHVGLRNESELDAFLAEVTNPESPKFGHYMTHDEFAAKHLPSAKQLAEVKEAFEARGFTVSSTTKGGMVHMHGSVQQAEKAFNVRLRHYQDEAEHRTVRAPEQPLQLPPGLGIISVHGLATAPIRHPAFMRGEQRHANAPGANASLIPYGVASIRGAYSLPPQANGSGEVLGMMELDGYKQGDIAAYAKSQGIGLPKLTDVRLGGYDGQPIASQGGQLEVTLDIELAMATAPNLAEIVVYEADQTQSDTAWFDLWNEMANPADGRIVKTISVSWGSPEGYMSQATANSENAILKQMAAQGQSVFVAAGDNGAYDDGKNLVTDDPASQRWSIAVGGTNLHLTSARSWASEKTWLNGGGGVSRKWRAPTWQLGAKTTYNKASNTVRNVPDVSLNADPATGYAVLMNNGWTSVGGTSCAAPAWAGFWAAVQSTRVAAGKQPLGFAAPILWNQGKLGVGYHDIADNSSNGYYRATKGYDNATGWGTLDGAAMYSALTGLP